VGGTVVAVVGGAVVAAAVVAAAVVVVVGGAAVVFAVVGATVVLTTDTGGSAGAGVPDDGPRHTTRRVRRSRTSRAMMVRATFRPDLGRCIGRTVVVRGGPTMGL
jgi:hypothetical protein